MISPWPEWEVAVFNSEGWQIADISEALFDQTLTLALNDVDVFTASMYLEENQAQWIEPLTMIVKVWRHVPGHARQPRSQPHFCGIISSMTRNAQAGTINFTAHSPFWRLKFRYHIDPHDFTYETGVGDIGTGVEIPGWSIPEEEHPRGTDPSEIMWQMIYYTNNLIVSTTIADKTGIAIGTFAEYGNPNAGVLLNNRYERGQNTWDLIQEIVAMPGMPDLDPEYIHAEGSPYLMKFNTVIHKGRDLGFTLDYNTGDKNLTDLTESVIIEPGNFATYQVVQGQGDSNADQTIVVAYDGFVGGPGYPSPPYKYVPVGAREGFWGDPEYFAGTETLFQYEGAPVADLVDEYGLYMAYDKEESAITKMERSAITQELLLQRMHPLTVYEPYLSSALVWAWPYDFDIGDFVYINCERPGLSISNLRHRVTGIAISRNADHTENVTLTLRRGESYKTYVSDPGFNLP